MKKSMAALAALGLAFLLYSGDIVIMTPGQVSVGMEVQFRFNHEGAGSGAGCAWIFGDGHTENTADNGARHVYRAAGTYTVTCTRLGGQERAVSGQITITVVDNRRLSALPGVPRANQKVFFHAEHFSPSGLNWDYGDGSVEVGGPQPVHVYSSPGNYRVRVWEQAAAPESAVIMNLMVQPDSRQISIIGPETVFEGAEAQFEGRGFVSQNITWDFGDGTVERGGGRQLHRFQRPGTFMVTAVAADMDETPLALRVPVLADGRSLLLNTNTGFVGSEFEIEARGFLSGLVSWDFGDGTILSGPPLMKHRYAQAGQFRVRAVDFAGREGKSFEALIQVTNDSRALSLPAEIIVGEEVALQLQNAGNAVFNWRFSDGESRSGAELLRKVFRSIGPHLITVSDPAGAYPPLEKTVHVVPDSRSLKASSGFILPQEAVTFTTTNFKGPGILWDFGDGTLKENGLASETHVFRELGRYRVKAVDFNGRSSKPFNAEVVVAETTPGFEVTALEFAFDNGKYYRVIARNSAAPGYQLRIKAKGRAVLSGQFILDSQSIGLFQMVVQEGQAAALPIGQMAALPVLDLGLHELTIRFSNYSFSRRIPVIKYFVSAAGFIEIVSPESESKVPLAGEIWLRWASGQKKARFEVAVSDTPLQFLNDRQIAWLPAGADSSFRFDPTPYQPGDWIYWQVRALDESRQVLTVSEIYSFRLDQ